MPKFKPASPEELERRKAQEQQAPVEPAKKPSKKVKEPSNGAAN